MLADADAVAGTVGHIGIVSRLLDDIKSRLVDGLCGDARLDEIERGEVRLQHDFECFPLRLRRLADEVLRSHSAR